MVKSFKEEHPLGEAMVLVVSPSDHATQREHTLTKTKVSKS